jgi:two-component system sensor histidine kinase HydH
MLQRSWLVSPAAWAYVPAGCAAALYRRLSGVKPKRMPNKTFNLRLWFAAGSFGTIAAICLLSAFWVANFLTRSLLERESEVSQEFLESIVTVDGPAIFREDGSEPMAPNPLLLDFSRHIISMPGMLRVNIHAPSHRVLWSTEQQIIGNIFEVNDELDNAFRGARVTEIGSLPDNSKPEHVALGQSGHFIEAYIPIRADGGRGPVLGVVEFYKLPLALDATIQSGRRAVWIGATFAAIVLFLTLYWIVQRGARLIERQQQHMMHLEAFAAIGQMASAVAHSLRNPMSAIRSSAELWRSQQPQEKREVADEVIREVDRMDGYVRDLLSYARAEPYHLQPVAPLKVIEAVVGKQQPAIARNRIDVETRAGDNTRTKVMADEMLLEQALTSVVTNAIEAMPDGGKLSVSIAPGSEKGKVRIAIADTGRGIPAELLERVTESYFTTKARGLGLGLVLAKNIIERFQGKLDIASTRGAGTTVCIDLKSA